MATYKMPEKGWRKKIHGKQPRALPPLKTTSRDASGEDSGDRRRAIGWRKTIQGSRPDTPSSMSPLTPTINDADDVRSEPSEPQTPRHNSKPKVARYTSLFSSFKESSKGPDFTEPWSESSPPSQSYIDPLHALQSVYSHMINFSTPIPLEHNNGLFRVFEDYRKVRHEKERLEYLLQDTLTNWTRAEAHWADSEFCYKAEIRRLEILIANGTGGMTGLFKARQGSIIDRKRGHRRTISYDKHIPTYNFVSDEELNSDVHTRSQPLFLQRPVSPSGKMASLSKYLMNTHADQLSTEFLNQRYNSKLSRKVQSELNLKSIVRGDEGCSFLDPNPSDSVGDPSVDQTTGPLRSTNSELEIDSFIALRELGGLIARRRGIEIDTFVEGLMALLSNVKKTQPCPRSRGEQSKQSHPSAMTKPITFTGDQPGQHSIQRRNLRRFQSQPQLSIDQQRRRHFSFDLGDDQLEELEAFDINTHSPAGDVSSELETSPSLQGSIGPRAYSVISTPSPQNLSADIQKPSKIPSPVGTLGRTRREDSTSSLQTVCARPADGRRDSNSSIGTAFMEYSRNSLRTVSTSGNSSHKLCTLECTAAPKHLRNDCRDSKTMVALTVAEQEDGRTPPGSSLLVRSDASSSSSAALLFGRLQAENFEFKN